MCALFEQRTARMNRSKRSYKRIRPAKETPNQTSRSTAQSQIRKKPLYNFHSIKIIQRECSQHLRTRTQPWPAISHHQQQQDKKKHHHQKSCSQLCEKEKTNPTHFTLCRQINHLEKRHYSNLERYSPSTRRRRRQRHRPRNPWRS